MFTHFITNYGWLYKLLVCKNDDEARIEAIEARNTLAEIGGDVKLKRIQHGKLTLTKIPADTFINGCRIGDKCGARLWAPTLQKAMRKAKQYFNDYPVGGYSTRITHIRRWNMCWEVVVFRWGSCD